VAATEIVPVDREQAELGRHAYRAFGKGRHPAGLNYGDCFAYALSKQSGEPLLYKGEDFTKTDVRAAIAAEAGDAPSHRGQIPLELDQDSLSRQREEG
jgi:uncharacterized protein with PIN domain